MDVSFRFYSIGVVIGFQEAMPNMFNISPLYFFWESNINFGCWFTSIPIYNWTYPRSFISKISSIPCLWMECSSHCSLSSKYHIHTPQDILLFFKLSWQTNLHHQDHNVWNWVLEDDQPISRTKIMVLVWGHTRILKYYILYVPNPSQQILLVGT